MRQLPTLLAPSGPSPSGILIRAVDGADSEGLRSFYEHLSAESRRSRFLGSGARVSTRQCEAFCHVDHQHREGFVAVLSELGPRDGLIVGHLCLEPADHGREEIALAVADAFQGRGIGRQLVRAAVDWARKQGTHELVATAFASNARILRLLRSIPGEPSVLAADGGLVEAVIPLAA